MQKIVEVFIFLSFEVWKTITHIKNLSPEIFIEFAPREAIFFQHVLAPSFIFSKIFIFSEF